MKMPDAAPLTNTHAATRSEESPSLSPHQVPTLRLQASKGWVALGLKEVWEYRELLGFLTWRDIKVRYKQTVLGASWAIIQPFCSMLVFSLFFGKLAKMPSDGVPYPVWSFAGLVIWTFFSNGLNQTSNSLVGSAGLITKVYFPRLTVPIAAVMAGVVDLLVSFAVLLVMMLYYGSMFSLKLILVPVFIVLALITALGVGLWLSSLNVRFRDIRYVLPFLNQFWMYATPVVYPSSLLPEPWRTLSALNPMVGVVEGFRWATLGTHAVSVSVILTSTISALAILLSGAFYFRRMEKSFADIV